MITKNSKKILVLAAILFLHIALFGQTTALPPSNFGDADAGTVENPYLIANLANLRWLSESPDVWGEVEENEDEEYEIVSKYYFQQTANIDATETINWNEGEGFRPIGFAIINPIEDDGVAYPFVGGYDGGEFFISNLFINPEITEDELMITGMFGFTVLADIYFVNLHNINIIGGFSAGAIVGWAQNSYILGCGATGSISGEVYSVGGIAGQLIESSIGFCYSMVNIDVNSQISTGGLVGALVDGGIYESFFNGTLLDENDSFDASIGGIAGIAMFGAIENVYIVIKEANDNVFGFVADLTFSDISYSFWNNEISGITEGFREEIFSEITDCFGLSTAEMKITSTYVNNGWDFDQIWTIDTDKNDGYPILRTMPDPIVNEIDKTITIPAVAQLHSNYPNPFNPTTTITFDVVSIIPIDIKIDIYNVKGQKVRSLVDGMYSAGSHSAIWNGMSDNGQSVSSGVYFYQMTTGNNTEVKRMVMMK